MPGPFPGMDPWVEDPHRWMGRHNGFIAYLCEVLNQSLPAGYAAFIEERVYLADGTRVSDVGVQAVREAAVAYGGGSTVADPPLIVRRPPLEEKECYVNVLDMRRNDELVATFELLSPSNKTRGTEGWRQYSQKQDEMLRSPVHFIELDLLRAGERRFVVSDREPLAADHWHYGAALYRAGQADSAELWLRTVRERLPVITLPLREDEPESALDVQAVFDRFYDSGIYRQIKYWEEPVPPLEPDDAAWADALLRENGLRH